MIQPHRAMFFGYLNCQSKCIWLTHISNSILKDPIWECVQICVGYSDLSLNKPHVLAMVKEAFG